MTWRRAALLGAILLGVRTGAAAPDAPAESRPTFSVDYVVRISARDPAHADVRWLLAGIDEIRSFRIVFRDDRTRDVSGTGRLTWHGRTLEWVPGGPYAHLRYTVALDHARPPGPHLDSHGAPDWVATRALYLFPEINVRFHGRAAAARARARLIFRLPAGWRSAAVQPRLDPDTYLVEEPGKHFDRPRGWFLLGRIASHRHRLAGAEVEVAVAPGSTLDVRRLTSLFRRTIPLLAELLGPPPPRLLVVSAPDPMWHGGLSGEDSFFVNGHIPVRSADRTSTYLHELFHVWAPFRPAADGQWIAEGLAEYYSLALQHRAGRLSDRGFARGLTLFARAGRWNVNLTRTRLPEVLNNSAPLVLHALDRTVREASGGRRSLDDVVRTLVADGGPLTTADLVRAAGQAAGRDLTPFFRRHVFRGERPELTPAPATQAAERPATAGASTGRVQIRITRMRDRPKRAASWR